MFKKISIFLVFFLFVTLRIMGGNGKFTLVIDPGHGGHDSGALGSFSKEKDINLNVSLAFGKYVQRNCPDVNVIYTRTTDVFVPLHTRADIANRAKADLFISVHTNSVGPGNDNVKGFQVYTLGMHRAKDNLDVAMRENSVISMESDYKQTYQGFDPRSSESYIMFEFIRNANMEKSVELARLIDNFVVAQTGRNDKGVHQAGFLVLRETSMPSCLIELGFITSSEEEQYLNTARGIDDLAYGIYKAFVKYKNMYNRHITVPYRTPDNGRLAVGRIVPSETTIPSSDRVNTQVSGNGRSSTRRVNRTTSVTRTNTVSYPSDAPVFKVQILASSTQLPRGSYLFHNHDEASMFQEGDWYKYTIGSSNNYNEIRRLRERLLKDFPQAFIIAFKNGRVMNINVAIREFLRNKGK